MTENILREYSIFTGCLIPSKYPFIEKASRLVLRKLGVILHNIPEASCCPNQMAIQSSDKSLWYLIAARNIALAEKKGCDIMSLCNGCYDTLKTVNSKLKTNDKLRNEINEKLSKVGLEYKGIIDVKHVVQVFHDDIGANEIEKKIEHSLGRFNFAPFVGCHVKRPMDHMGFDDPEKPYYLKDLIKVTGAKIVAYSDEHSCCGGGLSIGREHDAVPFARRVLLSAREAGGHGVVVNCPYCFAQLFRSEIAVEDIYSENLGLPIFYFTQLIGLAMGFKPEELGLSRHYEIGLGNEEVLVNKLYEKEPDNRVYNDEVTREQLEICNRCQACTDDCSTAMTTSLYRPDELVEMILEGKVDEVLKREDIWYCMNCHECIEKCPQNFGMVKLIVRLKNLAAERGIKPDVVMHRIEELKKSGYSFPPDTECREDMGLLECVPPEMALFKKIMEELSSEKSSD
jgi:CoB--CoM heterodisulfide reductase subunit B